MNNHFNSLDQSEVYTSKNAAIEIVMPLSSSQVILLISIMSHICLYSHIFPLKNVLPLLLIIMKFYISNQLVSFLLLFKL